MSSVVPGLTTSYWHFHFTTNLTSTIDEIIVIDLPGITSKLCRALEFPFASAPFTWYQTEFLTRIDIDGK